MSASMLQLYRTRLNAKSLSSEALLGTPEKRISAFGIAHGIPVIDLLPAFQAGPPGAMYLRNRSISYDPVRPSVLGHQVAAQQIFQFLSTPSGESMLVNKQEQFSQFHSDSPGLRPSHVISVHDSGEGTDWASRE